MNVQPIITSYLLSDHSAVNKGDIVIVVKMQNHCAFLTVSSICAASPQMLAIINVWQFPPVAVNAIKNRCVVLEYFPHPGSL